jgi:shikimate kinase
MKTERIIGMKNKTFEEIFKEREELYLKYADVIFDYSGSNIDKISNNLLTEL